MKTSLLTLGSMILLASPIFAGAPVPSPVPEPATILLIGGGIAAVVAVKKFKGRK